MTCHLTLLRELPFYLLFHFSARRRWGWGSRVEEQGQLLPCRIGCIFSCSWALGKCSNVSLLRVIARKGGVLCVSSYDKPIPYRTSFGKSRGAREYWKQWNCGLEFFRYCILNYIMNVSLAFNLHIWKQKTKCLWPIELGRSELMNLAVLVPWVTVTSLANYVLCLDCPPLVALDSKQVLKERRIL